VAGTRRAEVVEPEQDYLCDGLTEEMIAHLSGADPARLGVIARTSAMHYKRTTKRADEIGCELGVGYLFETLPTNRLSRANYRSADRCTISGSCC
jgi:TolB-like protein